MIVGNGDLASALKDSHRSDLYFFASGVSNSKETDPKAFKRERDLLLEQPRDAHLVYFGSLSCLYADSPYTRHKRDMEAMVKENFENYCIVRIGNILWGDNPHTIVNYFKHRLKHDLPLKTQDTFRYLVGKDEFLYWVNLIPPWPYEMNIPGVRLKAAEIVDLIVNGEI